MHTAKQDNGLTVRQKRLLAALPWQKDVRAACKVTGISERAAWRWLSQPAFRSALATEQDAVLADATRHASSLLVEALDVLAGIMCSQGAPYSARVAAAGKILDAALRFTELCGLAARVSELESIMMGKDR